MQGTLGEIRMFAGDYPPQGWAFCDGQSMSISANSALFSLLDITYGGDGQKNFLLPDLRGKVPVGAGQAENGHGPIWEFQAGYGAGSQTQTIAANQLPTKSSGSGSGTSNAADTKGEGTSVAMTGAQPSPIMIMQPYMPINYIICIVDDNYPART